MTKNLSQFLPIDTSLVSNDGEKKSSLSTDTAKFLWLTANWKKLANFDYLPKVAFEQFRQEYLEPARSKELNLNLLDLTPTYSASKMVFLCS